MDFKMLEDADFLKNSHGIAVRERIFDEGYFSPPHWHGCFELEIILSGLAEHTYNGIGFRVERGCAYLLSGCDFHAFRAQESTRIINICFDGALLGEQLASVLSVNPRHAVCRFDEAATALAEQKAETLKLELTREQPFSDIMLQNTISQLVIMLLRHSDISCETAAPPLILHATALINQCFRGELSLGSLADRLSVSPNYLGQLFKKSTGITYNEYVSRLRLRYACRLLTSTDLSVKEIAFASGFSSAEYFSDAFRRCLALTPLSYRKMKKNIV